MAITSTTIEERGDRVLSLVEITETVFGNQGKPIGGQAFDVYELTCQQCGETLAQLPHRSDAEAAWDDPCKCEAPHRS